jgi:hypothetical protein
MKKFDQVLNNSTGLAIIITGIGLLVAVALLQGLVYLASLLVTNFLTKYLDLLRLQGPIVLAIPVCSIIIIIGIVVYLTELIQSKKTPEEVIKK